MITKILERNYLQVLQKESPSAHPCLSRDFCCKLRLEIKTHKRDDMNNGYLYIRGGFGCGEHTYHYKVDPQDVRICASNLDEKARAIVVSTGKARVGLGNAKSS